MISIPRKPVGAPLYTSLPRQDDQSPDLSSQHSQQEEHDAKDGLMMREYLLREISGTLGTIAETSRHELRLLHSISERIAFLEDSKVEFLWNAVLQTIGIVFVIIFGVFAVLAYNASQISNKQSFEANQLALLAFCAQVPYAADGICLAISQQAAAPMTSLATAVLGSIQLTPTTSFESTATTFATTFPTSSSAAPSTAQNTDTSSSSITEDFSTSLSTSLQGSSAPTASPTRAASSTSSSETLTATLAPFPTTPSVPAPHETPHLSAPAITGIVIGVISVLISVGVSGFVFRSKFRRRPDPVVSPATYD